jgi:uncharacterized protein YlaI
VLEIKYHHSIQIPCCMCDPNERGMSAERVMFQNKELRSYECVKCDRRIYTTSYGRIPNGYHKLMFAAGRNSCTGDCVLQETKVWYEIKLERHWESIVIDEGLGVIAQREAALQQCHGGRLSFSNQNKKKYIYCYRSCRPRGS